MTGQLNFTPSEIDLRNAYGCHFSRFTMRRALVMVVVGLVIGIVMALLTGPNKGYTNLIIVLATALWGLVVAALLEVLVRRLWLPRFARRVFKQQADLQHPTELRWDSENFYTANKTGNGTMAWNTFHRWKRGKDMLLLYRSEAMFHFIPLRDNNFAAAVAEIEAHLRAAGVEGKAP